MGFSRLAALAPALGLGLGLGLGAVAAMAETRETAEFDIYLRGIKAADITIASIEEGSRYSAAANMASRGLVGMIRTVTYAAKVQGRIVGGRTVPSVYEETRNNNGAIRTVRMAYRDGVPQGREMTPPRPPRDDEVAPETQGGTWDMMTTIWRVFRTKERSEVCRLNETIYDGRRVARIAMRAPEVAPRRIVCRAEYLRIAGFADAEMSERTRFPFTLIYEPAGGGAWRVVQVDMETAYGSGRMIRR